MEVRSQDHHEDPRFAFSVTLIAFGATLGLRVVQGQTVSFFRQIVTPGMELSAAAADASGVYVFGSGSRTAEAGLGKYDSRGNELWTRAFRTPGGGLVSFRKAAASTSGVYVAGININLAWSGMRKYGTNGDELWNRQLGFGPADIAVDSSGVYVTGISPPISGIFYKTSYLRKYSLDGSELWTRLVSGPRTVLKASLVWPWMGRASTWSAPSSLVRASMLCASTT
jgi:hypothetical protein